MQDDESKTEETGHTVRAKLYSSLKLSLFKRLHKFFGSLLSILIIIFTALTPLYIHSVVLSRSAGDLGAYLNIFMTAVFLLMVIASLYYLVSGVLLILIKRKSEKDNRLAHAKRMILRGLAGIVALSLIYFLLVIIDSIFWPNEDVANHPPLTY